MHPIQKGVIDVNERGDGSLIWKIDLEILEQTSKNHPLWEIPTKNQQIIQKYKIDDESRNWNTPRGGWIGILLIKCNFKITYDELYKRSLKQELKQL